ncbi:transposable element Tcb2 transposase [Trichonephila clavipes]|nr:transposable element Tcb2 transposase [Trichonephila clavipes]
MPASSIRRHLLHRGLRARVPLYRIPFTANHRRLRLQWAHEHRAWQSDWTQVVFSDESRFNFWDHDGCIRVRRYAGERCFPECVIERHSGLTPGIMVWGAYHGRSHLLRIRGNLNSYRSVSARSRSLPSRHTLELSWSRIMHAHKLQRLFGTSVQPNAWNFFLRQNMSPIDHVRDLVCRPLARHPRSAASKDELLLRIQAIWNSLPQADIQNLFDSMPHCLATLIVARGGCTKY